jgi:hypothetical protein
MSNAVPFSANINFCQLNDRLELLLVSAHCSLTHNTAQICKFYAVKLKEYLVVPGLFIIFYFFASGTFFANELLIAEDSVNKVKGMLVDDRDKK